VGGWGGGWARAGGGGGGGGKSSLGGGIPKEKWVSGRTARRSFRKNATGKCREEKKKKNLGVRCKWEFPGRQQHSYWEVKKAMFIKDEAGREKNFLTKKNFPSRGGEELHTNPLKTKRTPPQAKGNPIAQKERMKGEKKGRKKKEKGSIKQFQPRREMVPPTCVEIRESSE